MKTYGNPLKRARSLPVHADQQQATTSGSGSGGPPSGDPLRVYQRTTSRSGASGRTTPMTATTMPSRLQRSPSSSQSSASPSPSPPAYPPRPAGARVGSASRSSSSIGPLPHLLALSAITRSPNQMTPEAAAEEKGREDGEEYDPFADPFGAATQPIEDGDDEEAPAPTGRAQPPLMKVTSLTGRFNSAAVPKPATPVASSSASSTSLQLSGASRARADDLHFLLDGLNPAQSPSERSQSALKLLQFILAPTAHAAEADGFCLMRTTGGFATLGAALPNAREIRTKANAIYATLLATIAFLACQDATNAPFLTSTCIDGLFALAFPPPASQANGDDEAAREDADMADAADSEATNGFGALRKSKKRHSQPIVTAGELMRVFAAHQRSCLDGSATPNPSHQLHLASMARVDYLSLIALASFTSDATFTQNLLGDTESHSKRDVLRAIFRQLREAKEEIARINKAAASARSTSKSKGRERANPSTPPPSSSSSVDPSFALAHHRLLCCLTIVENISHHRTADFADIARAGDDTEQEENEPTEEKKMAVDEGEEQPPKLAGTQLLFDILSLMAPNIEHQQVAQAAAAAAAAAAGATTGPTSFDESAPSMSLSVLPVAECHPISSIFCILRIFVNATNRNDAGVQAMNARYTSDANDTGVGVSGLQHLFRLLSSIPWSFLSSLVGQPDMFNLLSVGLPIIVNCVEWSDDSRRNVEHECRVDMRPENEQMRDAALAALPTPPIPSPTPRVGGAHSIPALEFATSLWSFLHHQLRRIAAAHAEEEARRAPADSSPRDNAQPDEVELTLEQRLADPFAAAAAASANGRGRPAAATTAAASSPGATDLEHQLVVDLESADQAAEEVALGYRTLASMTSLLLGFFACSSVSHSQRLLAQLRLDSFAPLFQYIQEFLLLQSDSQLLAQEGLETTFKMVEELKRREKEVHMHQDEEATPTPTPDRATSQDEPSPKKQKVDRDAALAPTPMPMRSPSPPAASSNGNGVAAPARSPSKFDELFNRSVRRQ